MRLDSNSDSSMENGGIEAPFIVRFYGKDRAADNEGRTLDEICAFSNNELEYHHDYIQVLFPVSLVPAISIALD